MLALLLLSIAGADPTHPPLANDYIFQHLFNQREAMGACVDEQRRREPEVTGKLVMQWTIAPNGTTSNIEVLSAEHANRHIATCITELIRGLTFPLRKASGETRIFPIKF